METRPPIIGPGVDSVPAGRFEARYLLRNPLLWATAAATFALFFAGTSVRSNFLCSLGYGDPAGVRPRGPRLAFDEMAKII